MTSKKVMCFGTFDLFHLGHLSYFKQAKDLGEHLTVVIARDKTKQNQKKSIIFSELERLELVKNLRLVDEAVLGDEKDHFKVIERIKPDIICLGYDHKITKEKLKEKLSFDVKVVRLLPYLSESNKSSKIKEKILNN